LKEKTICWKKVVENPPELKVCIYVIPWTQHGKS